MTTKGGHNTGAIDVRGEGVYRLRFRVNGKRCTVTVRGTKKEAQLKLRELLHLADHGEHVAPNRMTLRQWADQWLALLARGEANGRPRGLVGARTRERYSELFNLYVLPVLGAPNCSRSGRWKSTHFTSASKSGFRLRP
jgi:hypothetical protein